MSSNLTRAEQLARLRADAETKLNRERDLLDAAVSGDVMPRGSTYLFSRPRQFPGWHLAVSNLLLDVFQLRAYGMPVSIERFHVEDGALSAEFTEDVPDVIKRLLNASLRTATEKACCNCGEPRDNQPTSVERMACGSCAFVDLAFENDIEAKSAAAWVPLTEH